eukprot:Gb_34590 [translate_table: standard]
MSKEEEQIFPLLTQHFSLKEQAALVWQFVCSIHVNLMEEFLPWLVSSLSIDDRKDMIKCMCKLVLEVVFTWLKQKRSTDGFEEAFVPNNEQVPPTSEESWCVKEVAAATRTSDQGSIVYECGKKICKRSHLFHDGVNNNVKVCIFHSAVEDKVHHFLDEEFEVLPLARGHYSIEEQRNLLYQSLRVMPLADDTYNRNEITGEFFQGGEEYANGYPIMGCGDGPEVAILFCQHFSAPRNCLKAIASFSFAMEIHQIKRCMVRIVLLVGPDFNFFSWHRYMLFVSIWVELEEIVVTGRSTKCHRGLLSATDPVVVVALLKDLGASKNLSTTMKGESLMNDGVALGAVALGLVSVLSLDIIFNDMLIEITLTLAVSYVAYTFLDMDVESLGIQSRIHHRGKTIFKAWQGKEVIQNYDNEQLLNARDALGEIDVEEEIMNNLLELVTVKLDRLLGLYRRPYSVILFNAKKRVGGQLFDVERTRAFNLVEGRVITCELGMGLTQGHVICIGLAGYQMSSLKTVIWE